MKNYITRSLTLVGLIGSLAMAEDNQKINFLRCSNIVNGRAEQNNSIDFDMRIDEDIGPIGYIATDKIVNVNIYFRSPEFSEMRVRMNQYGEGFANEIQAIFNINHDPYRSWISLHPDVRRNFLGKKTFVGTYSGEVEFNSGSLTTKCGGLNCIIECTAYLAL